MIKNRSYQMIAFSIVVVISMLAVVLLAGGASTEDSTIPIHVDIFIEDKKISLNNSGNFLLTILSTNGFDATNDTTGVNISSVRFQGIVPFSHDKSDEVNLRLHFHSGSDLQCGNDRTVYLIGKTKDGRDIVGWINNITIEGCKYNGDYQPHGAPNITSFSPPTPVTNNVGVPITFRITVNQTVDVIWYFSGTLIQLNASMPEVIESSYTYSSPSPDTWNVTAVANNANGTDSQIWEWIANKADQTITFGHLADKTYGDPDFTVSATASSGLPVSFTAQGTCTVSDSGVHITGAGSCTITAQQAGNASYNAATDVAQSFNIVKRSVTITAEDKSKPYGAALPALTVSYTGLVNGDTAPATPPTVTTTATASSPAGTYPITASGALDPNYTISYVDGTLTVTQVALTIIADDKSKAYGAALPALTVSYTGLVNGDTAPATPPTVTTTATASSPAGTYPITASGALDPNYTISYVDGTLTVTQVALTNTEPILTSTTTSSKESSSGCGKNVNSKENPSNVKQHEFSREVDVHISKGIIVFDFETLGIVNEIGFTPRTNEGCITALGEILKIRPSQASSDAPHPVIAYFNAWVGPLGYSESSKIENPYVVFKVSEDSEPVQLMSYKNGEWIQLKTEKIGKGTFKAYTQGYGSFAIVEVTETPPISQTATTLSAVTNDPVQQKPVNWFLIIVAFAVVASIAIIYHQNSKG